MLILGYVLKGKKYIVYNIESEIEREITFKIQRVVIKSSARAAPRDPSKNNNEAHEKAEKGARVVVVAVIARIIDN